MFFGLETEYALGREPGCTEPIGHVADRLFRTVAALRPHLPARPGGVFLGNGARFYIDAGAHPEFATPEVSSPWDAHRYVLAGDRLLEAALAELARCNGPRLRLARSNVDYSSEQTWACHENYSYQCNPARLPPNLIPHLVSRICYTGAGGLDPFRPLRFVLSPRVAFLESNLSGNSTSDRGIYHLKDEPLATDGSRRLHVLCGESLCCERAALLRVGTTALVLAVTMHGDDPGQPLTLREPLAAMRAFNADPTLQRQVNLADGRCLSALEMQHELLAAVERRLGDRFLPDWAPSICELWRETLDALARNPKSLHTELDWALKQRLFTAQRESAGLSAEHCAAWDQRIVSQPRLFDAFAQPRRIAAGSPLARLLARMEPPDSPPEEQPLGAELPPPALRVIALRQQLAELDARFTEFTAERRGLFRHLQEAGAITEPVITEQSVRTAMNQPPSAGRAKLRGDFVRVHSGAPAYTVDWDAIRDGKASRVLPLKGPDLANLPDWQSLREMEPSSRGDFLGELLAGAEAAFNAGDYLGGWQTLLMVESALPGEELCHSANYLFLVTRLGCRSGHFAAGLTAAGRLADLRGNAFNAICSHIVAHRYEGLVAGSRMWTWIRRGLDLLASPDAHGNGEEPSAPERWRPRTGVSAIGCDDQYLFRQQWAHALLLAGRVTEAVELLEPLAVTGEHDDYTHPRIIGRAMVDLAECHRRLGQPEPAYRLLALAEQQQRGVGAVGDVADYTLRVRVKLETDDALAKTAVAEAEAIHQRARSPMGQARLLLVEARRLPEEARRKDSLRRLRELTARSPALQTCPLRQRIEREWDDVWCARRQPLDKSAEDFYWGL